MSKPPIIQKLELTQMKSEIPDFRIGDTVSVHYRVIEGNKERIQVFTGTVIARKGTGLSETFSLHRVAYGEGMERVFILHSPRIAKIEITKRGKVRRGKLYYLRGTTGKAAKVRGRVGPITTKMVAVTPAKEVVPAVEEETEEVAEEILETAAPKVEETAPEEPKVEETAAPKVEETAPEEPKESAESIVDSEPEEEKKEESETKKPETTASASASPEPTDS